MQQMILDQIFEVFVLYIIFYIPVICTMVPLVLILFPKDVNERYFGLESPNFLYTKILSSPSMMMFKATVIAANMLIIRWQHHKNLQGIHLACPKWYVRLCWVYYFTVVVIPSFCFLGIFVFYLAGY